MEPFEWLLLGMGLAVGALMGSRGKGVVRSAAKGYLIVEEKAKGLTANMREDFRDAVEEARYEREQEAAVRDGDYDATLHEAPIPQEVAEPTRSGERRAKTIRPTSRAAAGTRASTPKRTRRKTSTASESNGNPEAPESDNQS